MNKYYDAEHLSRPDTEQKLERLEILENRLKKIQEGLQEAGQKNLKIQELLKKISFIAMHIKNGTHSEELDKFEKEVEKL